eukprot:460872-Pleurochrysis_carterae.AAC.3
MLRAILAASATFNKAMGYILALDSFRKVRMRRCMTYYFTPVLDCMYSCIACASYCRSFSRFLSYTMRAFMAARDGDV